MREQGLSYSVHRTGSATTTDLSVPPTESAYASLAASTSSPPTLLSFLTSRYSAEGPHALLDRVRLKAILFLNTSAKYDVPSAKTDLEEIEVKGMRGLTLERVIVYGKVRFPQLLSARTSV